MNIFLVLILTVGTYFSILVVIKALNEAGKDFQKPVVKYGIIFFTIILSPVIMLSIWKIANINSLNDLNMNSLNDLNMSIGLGAMLLVPLAIYIGAGYVIYFLIKTISKRL
jgi:hypothetical protein